MSFPSGLSQQSSGSKGIMVASTNAKQSDPTDYSISAANMYLVMKFAPKTTGELRLSFEAKTNALQALNIYASAANRLSSNTAPLIVRNISTADDFNWLLPLGTAITAITESANTGLLLLQTVATSVTTYTSYSFVINVIEGLPLYLIAKNAAPTSSPVNNIRNITLSYDLMR